MGGWLRGARECIGEPPGRGVARRGAVVVQWAGGWCGEARYLRRSSEYRQVVSKRCISCLSIRRAARSYYATL